MIRYIKTFEVIFSTNNLSGMHISAMWHSLNVLKYFCPLSVYSSALQVWPLVTLSPYLIKINFLILALQSLCNFRVITVRAKSLQ